MRLSHETLRFAGYFHGTRAFTGPRTVQIDLTDACNQHCVVCWLHAPALAERNRERVDRAASLPYPVYLELLDDLKALGTEELYFAGGGEPMLHKQAWEALGESVRRGFTTSLHTNFTRIEEPARLIDLGVHHVTVSLWAGGVDSYAATHPGTEREAFSRVTAALRALNRRKVDRPRTKLYHVLTAENAADAEGMMALAEDLGCDAVEWAVADIVPGHTDGSALRPEQAAAVRGALDGLLSRAAWRSPRPLALPALLSRLDALARGEPIDRAAVHAMPCFAGWTYSRVMADGRVIPCLKSHRLPSGNLHDQRFRAIWEGSRQAAFRDAARSFAKSDPLLQHVGNDERAACGCETGCDNLAENKAAWGRLRAKSGVERAALRGIVSLPEALRARLT